MRQPMQLAIDAQVCGGDDPLRCTELPLTCTGLLPCSPIGTRRHAGIPHGAQRQLASSRSGGRPLTRAQALRSARCANDSPNSVRAYSTVRPDRLLHTNPASRSTARCLLAPPAVIDIRRASSVVVTGSVID